MSYIIDFLFLKKLAVDLQESKCLDACCFMALQDIESKGFALALPGQDEPLDLRGQSALEPLRDATDSVQSTDDGELGSYSARTLSAAKFNWQW